MVFVAEMFVIECMMVLVVMGVFATECVMVLAGDMFGIECMMVLVTETFVIVVMEM